MSGAPLSEQRAASSAKETAGTVSVRCFGEFGIATPRGWDPGPARKRGRDLLQYLVLRPGQPVSRARLSELFWPGADLGQVGHRLHIAASGARMYLRDVLGGFDAIRCTADGYAWHPGVTLRCDLTTFTALYHDGSVPALEAAATLYRGELFEGEEADWFQPARVKFATMFASTLERLARAAFDRAEFEAALDYGLELLAIDRADEGASRLVMRCFGAAGQRSRAMAEYAALCDYLKKHLGVEPMHETTRLIEQIVADRSSTAAAL